MVRNSVPNRGDVYEIDLNPVVGNEMRDTHRCVVVSPREINMLGLCLLVPITTGGNFIRKAGLAVHISGHDTTGVALCNEIRSLDVVARLKNRTARHIERLDESTTSEIINRVVSILESA